MSGFELFDEEVVDDSGLAGVSVVNTISVSVCPMKYSFGSMSACSGRAFVFPEWKET